MEVKVESHWQEYYSELFDPILDQFKISDKIRDDLKCWVRYQDLLAAEMLADKNPGWEENKNLILTIASDFPYSISDGFYKFEIFIEPVNILQHKYSAVITNKTTNEEFKIGELNF